MRRLGKSLLVGVTFLLAAAFVVELMTGSLGNGASPSPWISLVMVGGAIMVGTFYYRHKRSAPS